MAIVRSAIPGLAILALSLNWPLGAQVRDATQPPQRPTERQIPVGNSTISGTVTTADNGRPVRGARVMISGQVPQNAPAAGGQGRAGTPVTTSTVTMGRGGMPLGANVVSSSPSGLSRQTMTDANGQFSFPRLPAGHFTLSVNHNQFLSTTYGQRRPGGPGTYISVADGQQVTLRVPMLRGAVITGTVFGPDGEPQRNAQVRGWRYSMTNGVKRLQSTGYASTDDRGMYRMFSLQPGEYLISATPANSDAMNMERMMAEAEAVERAIITGKLNAPAVPGFTPTVSVPVAPQPQPGQYVPPPGYVPTYAPSALLPSSASTVTVAGGEEKSGIDVFVRLTQASVIQGDVLTALDPGVGVQVTLLPDDPTIDAPESNSTRADVNRKFTFRSVRPGKYTVFAYTVPAPPIFISSQPQQPQPPPQLTDAQKLWGKAQVSVAGEGTIDVDISLRPGRTISGVVIFDMARPPDLSRSRVTVQLTPAPSAQPMYYSSSPQAQVGPDGRFVLTGVFPGRYILRANAGGILRSSVVAGQDTLDFPIDFTAENDVSDAVLTLTDTASEVSGVLTDAAGKPAPDYMILVAASDSRYWVPGSRRITITRPAPDGRYVLRGLPPGSYFVTALFDLEPGAHYDPEFLRTAAGAGVPVTVLEGGKSMQDLRVK